MSGLRIDVLTLFPGAFAGPVDTSILGRARAAGLFDLHLHDIREHATDRHRTVDDYPFGGGQGMVMRVDVLDAALQHVRAAHPAPGRVVYLSPAGRPLSDALVRQLASEPRLILVCGRYEGVDERFVEHFVDLEVSIGDYVLTGGELPAMVLIDAVARHIPGVLGDETSPEDESFVDGLLEYPQYTRPADYRGWPAPPVLLGGDHARIEAWRREQRVLRTAARRPDLLPPGLSSPETLHRVGIAGVRLRAFDYPADVPALEALCRRAGVAGVAPPALAALVQANPSLLLVAVQGEQLVGALVAASDGFEARLHVLVVAQEQRRRGIGSALLDGLGRALASTTVVQLSALLPLDAEEAPALLRAAGWSEVGPGAVWRRRLPV